MTTNSRTAVDARSQWVFRPVILLAAAYLIINFIHESAHAFTAYALNIPFTLFNFAVALARDRVTLTERAVIAVAGPVCALIIGLICWFLYRRARGSRSELILLYLATIGAGHFFGNLMSATFVGDFSTVALALRLPIPARYAASLIGLLSVCVVHFVAGCELRRLSPTGSSRLHATIVMVGVPLIGATAIVALSFVPIPYAFVFGRLAESSFWIFGALGTLMSRKIPSGSSETLRLGWPDAAILAMAIIIGRIAAVGISFQQ